MSAPTPDGFPWGRSLFDVQQPPVSVERVARARRPLIAYRTMAFVTGVVLLAGVITLIVKYTTTLNMEPGTEILWTAHGYLYLVYVIVTVVTGFRLRWPLARMVLVLLAGTIPTASFVAEHVVTRALRRATVSGGAADQQVPVRE